MSNTDVTPRVLDPAGFALADGGIETALEARLGQELTEFAAFRLLESEEGRAALAEYYRPFLTLAAVEGMPLVLDTPTWRANPDWGRLVGTDAEGLLRANTAAAALVREVARHVAPALELTVSGCVGPRYEDEPAVAMTSDEAERYHSPQVRALAAAGVDRVTAVTMTDAAEAEGIVRAARAAGVPAMVSFAPGPDGRLGRKTLAAAILEVDRATDSYPSGYLVNCAHPSEAAHALRSGELGPAEARAITGRIVGFRLNAARHGEDGEGERPTEFARAVLGLRALAPSARVFGGCCGTDAPHIEALAEGLAGR